MKKRPSLLVLALGALFSCSTLLAATTSVEFSEQQSNGSFSCTVSDRSAILSIDTEQLEINGGCAGNRYVTSPGHLVGVPASVFESSYFEITKHLGKKGKAVLTAPAGINVTCALGHGSKPQAYGNGAYCMN